MPSGKNKTPTPRAAENLGRKDPLDERYNKITKGSQTPEPSSITVERSDNGRHIVTHNHDDGRSETHAVEPGGLMNHLSNAWKEIKGVYNSEDPTKLNVGGSLIGIEEKKKNLAQYNKANPKQTILPE